MDSVDVSEILVNRPGELWIERIGLAGMQRVEVAEVDDTLLERLAVQVARHSHQAVSAEHPLLAATLPSGDRVQVVAPPATRRHWALAIRRHVAVDRVLDDYAGDPLPARAAPPPLAELDAGARRDPIGFLRRAVHARCTVLASGGTSSGKTTFLASLLKEVPASERLVLVEDTPEIQVTQPNHLGLVAVRGDQGRARVDADDLLQAALRLRPDRILLGEIRGREAATFLRAINTGHPGSFSTVHASSPEGALDQLALMVMQAGWSLPRAETLDYVRSLVDVVVQLARVDGQRRITDLRVLNARAGVALVGVAG
ncbi:MAG: P-type DNA transfer ATPase VirB11 [Pseudoxanthomonas sp.]